MVTKPFPTIKTARLLLRKIDVDDSEVILFLRSDAVVNKYIERPEHRKTKTVEQAQTHIEKMNGLFDNEEAIAWGIAVEGNPKLIGTICLWNFSEDRKTAEVGYDLDPAFQGKGMMSEALKAVLSFGFDKLGFALIEAFTHVENEASKKLLVTNGFQLAVGRKEDGNLSNVIFEIRKPPLQEL